MGQPDSTSILTAVARLVAEAPTLRDMVASLATTLREAIPFERLHVLRLDRADSFELYLAGTAGDVEITAYRIGQAGLPTEPSDPDSRSRLLTTVRQGARIHAALWLTSPRENAFQPGQQ